ncbi:MAG: response regulator [Bacteroidales bacterium]
MADKISILIVDDEESVRDSLSNWFIEDGYSVECAENAKKALQMLEEKDFDIILADIKMPGMDGMSASQNKDPEPGIDSDHHDCIRIRLILRFRPLKTGLLTISQNL